MCVGGDIQLCKQLCVAVESTPICEVLNKVEASNCNEFLDYYLHDFVRLVHDCQHRDKGHETKEYSVSSKVLNLGQMIWASYRPVWAMCMTTIIHMVHTLSIAY